MQIYATECAAQVSTLACSILRRTPVVRPAMIKQADLGQRSLSKIYRGCAPAAIQTHTSFHKSIFLWSFFEALDLSCQVRPICVQVGPSWAPGGTSWAPSWGSEGNLGTKLGSQIDQNSIKKRIKSWTFVSPILDRFLDALGSIFGGLLVPS